MTDKEKKDPQEEKSKNTNMFTWTKQELLDTLAAYEPAEADKYREGTFPANVKKEVIELIKQWEVVPHEILSKLMNKKHAANDDREGKVVVVEYKDEDEITENEPANDVNRVEDKLKDITNIPVDKLTKREKLILEMSNTKRVIFHNTNEFGSSPTQAPFIFVGLNGNGYYIPKDQEVDVPEVILNGPIKDAVKEDLINYAKNGKWVHEWKKVRRYPFTVVTT